MDAFIVSKVGVKAVDIGVVAAIPTIDKASVDLIVVVQL